MKKTLFVVGWLACSFVDYGLMLGHDTHRWPDQEAQSAAIFFAFPGPFTLPVVLLSNPYHWRLKPLTTEERWGAFHELYPNLNREEFERTRN